jgi:cytochrome P450
MLCLHPDVQKRLREEIFTAIPNGLETAEKPVIDIGSTLESLPFLNGVCNETLRVLPSVPLLARVAGSDTTLIGQPIAANTRLIMSPWATNIDPALWGSDAAEFKPERWIDEDTNKPNLTGGASTNYAFLTFLHGSRSCIGQNFARAELRSLVAAFTAAYEWSLADPQQIVRAAGVVTTKPSGGLKIRISKVCNS